MSVKYLLWFNFFFGLKIFKSIWFLFSSVLHYDNKIKIKLVWKVLKRKKNLTTTFLLEQIRKQNSVQNIHLFADWFSYFQHFYYILPCRRADFSYKKLFLYLQPGKKSLYNTIKILSTIYVYILSISSGHKYIMLQKYYLPNRLLSVEYCITS